jgi:arylsulfatase A-like enzyme
MNQLAHPNILVIFADQLRRQALGCYGDPNVSTPNMDALAAGGVRFDGAYATYPICVPFRFSLMTGQYGHSRFVPGIEWRMSPAERTIADEFNEAGYHTLYVGKWHLYGGSAHLPSPIDKVRLTAVPRRHQGRFQRWLGFELCNDHFKTYYYEDADPTPRPVPGYQTDGLFDLCMGELAKRKPGDKPFFSILSVEPPHFPLSAPEEDLARWRGRELKLSANFLRPASRPSPAHKVDETHRAKVLDNLRTYYAMVENLDRNVGRMMAFLEAQGLTENTVVVLFSDHGQLDGSHCEQSTAKYQPYEEASGIPLIIHDPRQAGRAGSVVTEPLNTEDLMPTLLGLAGLRPKDELPGYDATPLARGELADLPRAGVLLEFVHDLRPSHCYYKQYYRGIRTRHHKYTVLGDHFTGGQPWQLFDMDADPGELHNLLDDPSSAPLARELHGQLRDLLVSTEDHFVLAPQYGHPGLNYWPEWKAKFGGGGTGG